MNAAKKLLTACLIVTTMIAKTQAGGFDPTLVFYSQIEKIESLTARFDQNTLDHEGYAVQSVNGLLKLARPDNIYWETKPPYEQVIVGNGKDLWVYDADLEQVTIRSADDVLEGPLTLLSESAEQIRNKYDVEFSSDENQQVFELSPTNNANNLGFASLQMTFENDILSNITIVDKLKQTTVIDLKDVELNAEIPADTFRFDIPEGVDVVNNE